MIKFSRLPIRGKIGLIRNLAALSTFLNYYNSAPVNSGAETMGTGGG
ncbi:hypothetical protein H6F92_06415 [Microcystis wesenbergii FACHB-1317]|nr:MULTISPECIES: hypothetical protein [Microcystis]MBD2288471.1 hypothetical protein [Microcystis wesenbergii FACHB-1317]UZO78674.1 hypothetical protein M8120_12830 [Microcystis aeruginosa str. Chao 1910]